MTGCRRWPRLVGWLSLACAALATGSRGACAGTPGGEPPPLRQMLDAPLLFAKRHSYPGIHIYDTYYKWRPGGGIYIIENPWAPPPEQKVRPLIDPTTPGTLGTGVYSDPELSWDAKRVLFCFKPTQNGCTCIYEIGIDGKGLRRLTDPSPHCAQYKGSHSGHHDVSPAYLPDGRIVFTSTRPNGLVPCANSGVDILHVMNADGTGIRPISVNIVNEFDPCVLPDGRILFGRWEYVDKTALTIQSLWTVFPDGTNETALFANNMAHPEALLDARAVPGSPHLIAASLTPHNSPPQGSIGVVDARLGKNGAHAITNFEHPDRPTYDRGHSCEPWPLSKDVLLFSGRPRGARRNVIEIMDRRGRRELVHADPAICCHSPMLIKPRPRPPALAATAHRAKTTGRFYVQDIYEGLAGVERGEVQWLRVIEQTSRTSPTPGGAYNQTFLVSAVLTFTVKNFLGVVPVEPDGSAYFEAPAGRAVYFQALDADKRLVRSMRTFVQAAPGVTRSCIGCHEHKFSTPAVLADRDALRREPHRLEPESWGSGYIDYPAMVQPILDKHCLRCHGGEDGIAGRLDLSAGWTEHFSISYENLVSRRETQVTAHLIAGIDCMNGTSRWSAQLFPPRSHGSGAAPLAEALLSGHKGRIPMLSRAERDLLLAWIDSNGLFHGTWDYTKYGCAVRAWQGIKQALIGEMQAAGCTKCHRRGRQVHFEHDWFNLQRPEASRILRAPLPEGKEGWGLGWCRDRSIHPQRQRIWILRTGHYVHHVLPMSAFRPQKLPPPITEGGLVTPFASTADPHYRAMLAIIREGRRKALAAPRADMPGAQVQPGSIRMFVPPPLPQPPPALRARVDSDGIVHLSWERSARTIGLAAEVHRGPRAQFTPTKDTLLATTTLFQYADMDAPQGRQHYALVLLSPSKRGEPARASITVPPPAPPPVPTGLKATAAPGRVELAWDVADDLRVQYHVYRAKAGGEGFKRLTAQTIPGPPYSDTAASEGVKHAYTVRAVNRRGAESASAPAVVAAALPEVREPVFVAAFARNVDATLFGGGAARGRAHGKARVAQGALDLRQGGFVTFSHRPAFDLTGRLSVECWVHFTREAQMPVVVSCGHWRQAGWFLQRIGAGWRWHVGGVDCDGGKPARGRWTHLVGTFDGRTARLLQDGRLVAEQTGPVIRTPWRGPLHVGQYSGGPAPPYQVAGWVWGVRVYSRALDAEDARAAAQPSPPPRTR